MDTKSSINDKKKLFPQNIKFYTKKQTNPFQTSEPKTVLRNDRFGPWESPPQPKNILTRTTTERISGFNGDEIRWAENVGFRREEKKL